MVTRNNAQTKVRCSGTHYPLPDSILLSDVNEEWTEERGPRAPGRAEIKGPGLPWRGQHIQQ